MKAVKESWLSTITFFCRTHKQYLQLQGEVELHAEVLHKLLPGVRAIFLQQVKEL